MAEIRESHIVDAYGHPVELKAEKPADWDDFWYDDLSGRSASGEVVTVDTALQLSAVIACVKVLSETLAQVPLMIFKRLPDGGKERAPDHPVYDLLHRAPNSWETSFGWRETLQSNLTLEGNAYSEIKPGPRGRVDSLIPLLPSSVSVKQLRNGRLVYEITDPLTHAKRSISQDAMFHVPGLSYGGITGLTPIGYARETMGVYRSTERYGANLFTSGGSQRIALQHPGVVSGPAAKKLRESWQATQGGSANSMKPAVLEEGMTAALIGMTASDAQFLENRKSHRTDIASIYRVPPHMIGELSRSTNNNIEQQALEFVMYTMVPWFTRWEMAINASLVTDTDNFFAEFIIDGLLRGAMKERFEAHGTAIMNGWMTHNEVRVLNNLNNVDGLDEPLVPLNMVEESSLDDNQAGTVPATAAAANIEPLARSAADRIIKAYVRKLKSREEHAANDYDKFVMWFGSESTHLAYGYRAVLPFCEAFGGNAGLLSAAIAAQIVAMLSSRGDLDGAIATIQIDGLDAVTNIIMEGSQNALQTHN